MVVFVSVPVIVVPVPPAAIPVRFTVLFLVQANVVPATRFGFDILIAVIAVAEQMVCVAGVAAVDGVGFTITVAVVEVEQPAAEAVIVNMVVC